MSESSSVQLNGREEQGGQNWDWQMQIAPAMGRDLFRYQSSAKSSAGSDIGSSLTIYILNAPTGQAATGADFGDVP